MLRGPPGKLLGCSQPYTTIRVLELPPGFQAGLVQRIQHLGVFTVHCLRHIQLAKLYTYSIESRGYTYSKVLDTLNNLNRYSI